MAKLINFTRKAIDLNMTKCYTFDLKSGILPLKNCTYSKFELK